MERLFLAATILVASLTLAQAQTMIPRPPPYVPYAPYAYAPYPYGPYPYGPYSYAPYYNPQRLPRHVATVANPGVAAVQRKLKELGFLPRTASIDGIAGSQTHKAIANWQRSLAHPTTGFLTPAEVQALFQPSGGTTPSPPTAAPQVSLPARSEVLGQAAVERLVD
jgi:hypothetical protein